MAVHVEETRCFIGDDSGTIVQLDSTATPVNATHLGAGVKCLIEDEGFVYAACNDRHIYGVYHVIVYMNYNTAFVYHCTILAPSTIQSFQFQNFYTVQC